MEAEAANGEVGDWAENREGRGEEGYTSESIFTTAAKTSGCCHIRKALSLISTDFNYFRLS